MAISAAVAAELAAILQSQGDSGCASWYMSLLRAADRAMAEAREDDSTALKSLGYACSMMLEPRAAPAPFRPILQMETGRSALPEDFDENVLGLFREAAASSTNPEFRARLLDVIWLRGRDPAAARDAIEAYFAAAESDILKYPHDRLRRVIRGAQLALQLNVGETESKALASRLEAAAGRCATAGKPQRALEIVEFMLAQDLVEPAGALAMLDRVMPALDTIGPPFVRRNILLFKARVHERLKETDISKKAVMQAAETFIEEAASADGPLAKSIFLEQAIHVLRGIRHHGSHADVVKRIDELKVDLMDLRDPILASMQLIELPPVDIKEVVARSVERVSGKEPREALLITARMLNRSNVASLRESAVSAIRDKVLGRLFGAKHLGHNGRTVGNRKATGDLSQPSEGEIRAQMLQTAAFHRRFVLAGYIEPARRCINEQRYVSEEDLVWLFDGNPMVPHGHEMILSRGLLAGIRGDFLVAGGLLIPQVEHLLRFRLNAQRIVTTGLNHEGIEDELPLEKLIGLAEKHGVIDESVAFDLRSLLTERTGDNLRNEHAHGMLAAGAYYSDAAIYLWAWVLHWLSIPHLKKQDAEKKGDRTSEAV